MATRGGFTIVEVLVALLLLNVGILGLVTTAGAITRMMRQGRQMSEAATLASTRVELLRWEGCGAAASGSDSTNGVALRWFVEAPSVPRLRLLRVTTTFATGPTFRGDSISTVLLCP